MAFYSIGDLRHRQRLADCAGWDTFLTDGKRGSKVAPMNRALGLALCIGTFALSLACPQSGGSLKVEKVEPRM